MDIGYDMGAAGDAVSGEELAHSLVLAVLLDEGIIRGKGAHVYRHVGEGSP